MAKKKKERPSFQQRSYTKKGKTMQKQAAPAPKMTQEEIEEEKKRRSNVSKHTIFVSIFIIVLLVIAFFGRWVYAIMNNYYRTFFQVSADVPDAIASMTGLSTTEDEQAQMLPLEKEWDSYTQSRLCDEVDMTASDGTKLHAHLYNEGSDKTIVVLQQFGMDGNSDFLPGTALTDCNILLLDARATGDSSGDYFSYGYLEQQDLCDWLNYTDELLGEQDYLIWGIGCGANTALFADLNGLLPENVTGIVAESPYGSLDKLARENIMDWFTLSPFPFVDAVEFRLRISHAGFTEKDTELNNVTGKSAEEIPVLFLTSRSDKYIQPEFTQEVYDAFTGEKELIEGSGNHGTVYTEKQDEILKWIQEYTIF